MIVKVGVQSETEVTWKRNFTHIYPNLKWQHMQNLNSKGAPVHIFRVQLRNYRALAGNYKFSPRFSVFAWFLWQSRNVTCISQACSVRKSMSEGPHKNRKNTQACLKFKLVLQGLVINIASA